MSKEVMSPDKLFHDHPIQPSDKELVKMFFPFPGDLLEDLPTWLLDWRQHLQRAQQAGFTRRNPWCGVGTCGNFFLDKLVYQQLLVWC